MNTALLLIDLQKGFEDEDYWGGNRNNPEMEENIQKLLDTWRNSDMPVIHVKHNSTTPGSLLRPEHPGNALMSLATPDKHEPLFEKNVNSAFIGTGLEKYLKEEGITTLVVVGLTTNHCISTTVRMAGNLGFKTFVVSDATATFDRTGVDGKKYSAEEVHAISLANLHNEFATVLDTQTTLNELLQTLRS